MEYEREILKHIDGAQSHAAEDDGHLVEVIWRTGAAIALALLEVAQAIRERRP